MSSAIRLLHSRGRTAVSAFSLIFLFPTINAQVTAVPKVVVDAQLGFEVTASGSPISLANPSGVAVAPDGTIYVADSSNSRIVEISTEGAISERPISNQAKIEGAATFLAPSSGLSEPNAVAVGPDGTLYFSDAVKKLLYRVTNPKSESPVYTQLTYSANQSPSALAVDTAGDLWVADGSLQEIIEFGPSADSASQRASVKPLIPTGIAVSASSVYFTDAKNNAVYGQGSKTPLLSGFAGTDFDFAADHAAAHPTGLGLDGAGNLFVLDAANKRLVEFNPDQTSTAFLVPFSRPGAPSSLAVGPTGNLYITDHSRHELNQLVYDGNSINFGLLRGGTDSSTVTLNYSFNAAASGTRLYQRMQGDQRSKFAFGDEGCNESRIRPGYTCQQQVHVNYPVNSAGLHKGLVGLSDEKDEVLGTITSLAVSQAAIVDFYPGTFSYLPQTGLYPALLEPQAVVVSGTGSDLFVADEGGTLSGETYTYAGKVWDYPLGAGVPVRVGGNSLVAPSALALNAAGDLYIADYSQGAIYIAPAINRLSSSKLTIPGGVTLSHPIALTFDPSGNLYIGDAGSSGFLASASSPGFIVKVPVGGGNASKLNYSIAGAPIIFPQALTTDIHGNLYIADAGDGQTLLGDLVVVPANTGTPSYIPTTGYSLSEPAGLSLDAALNLYVLDGYNARVLVMPITLANNGTPTIGAPTLLPQTIPIATGSSMVVWPSGQEITFADIGYYAESPVTQVLTLQTNTANLTYGSIPLGASQAQSVTAINVGNITANLTPKFTETGDTGGFTGPSNPCSGGIAAQQQCSLSFTYNPDQVGTTTAQFSFYVNSVATPSNYVNVTGTSTKATATVTIVDYTTPLVYPNGTEADIVVAGNFGVASGTVNLYDGATLLATIGLQGNGEGYYYIQYGTLSVGTHALTAVYSGNAEYSTATSAIYNVVVTPAITSMTGSCYYVGGTSYTCGTYLSAQTSIAPTGNVVYTIDGVQTTVPIVGGTALLTKSFAKGYHTVVVTYAQQGNYSAASVNESFTY